MGGIAGGVSVCAVFSAQVCCECLQMCPYVCEGSEWDYVLLSMVRSLPQREIDSHPSDRWRAENLGLITDQHQINVAITQARLGLIIIGTVHSVHTDLAV